MTDSNSCQTLFFSPWIILAALLGFPVIAFGAAPKSDTLQATRTVPSQQIINQARQPETSIWTGNIQDITHQHAVQTNASVCLDLIDIAQFTGQNPPGLCSENLDLGATSTSTSGSQDPPEPSSPNVELEDVLLLHGFSVTANHDCAVYWGAQENAIESAGADGNPTREAIVIGWYGGNTNCEVNLPKDNPSDPTPDPLNLDPEFNINTPLIDVAYELKRWIFDHYTTYGKSVDIVAHSLGGLVVRLMLEQWGQELMISDVVTLGTPHAGVRTLHLAPFCWAIGQCNQVEAGSNFITNLEHNPQSTITTQWTLIAAENDQVVGEATGITMESNGGPVVDKYEYSMDHKHGCSYVLGAFSSIGHQDLQGDDASINVYECNILGFSVGTVQNPTSRILDALD